MIYLQWQKKLPYFCEVTEEALKSKITLKVPPLCVTLVREWLFVYIINQSDHGRQKIMMVMEASSFCSDWSGL